ncbi:hypothetical protein AA0119_g13365 [Alternaria tenuissima]|uniref:HMA domain-containing protein n=2 Tax=Alternaria alternata complex TaxID=187734 RepID=A0A4Q4MRX5_ALTAL|nr:hypothetical protein AA0115_g12919 [Alternaria tenuissima]RYN58611.1 hypothetical protein AA0117_g13155 [Alternaria alternata]RYN21462.1 hypothetical protein AA0114_g12940 [Alternaria tenuissima]RYN82964.1 hypothetical protein AA0119_g13365 [Alternaria tenuissima]RYO02888.1 hypothetical protein AA0121_g13189 [Alternaria tenuissima]
MSNIYEFNVKMGCGGCASTVKAALNKVQGVQAVDTSVDHQVVTVTTDDSVTFEQVQDAIKGSGKEVKGSKRGKTVSSSA